MDLIDRADVHDLIAKRLSDYLTDETRLKLEMIDCKIEDCIPTVQATKTGHWIYVDRGYFKCSECDAHRDMPAFLENYCPNCGADMRGDNE